MQIIKNQQIIADTWRFIEDDADLGVGDVCVSLTRWQQEKSQLLVHSGKIGIRVNPGDNLSDLADDLKKIELVELNFPAFADGRLFSCAWLLRARYHYQGEIRAVGHYLPDQVYYLSRVGVNAFQVDDETRLNATLAGLKTFSVHYQTSIN